MLPLTAYVAINDYEPCESDKMQLKKGDVVEVLDTSQDDMWLVRRAERGSDIGFVTPTCLRKRNDTDV